MENLTVDLIIKILISLPLISIGRCRCVCKSWYELLQHHKFVSMKLNYDIEHENLGLLVTERKTEGYKLFSRNLELESKSLISSEVVRKIVYPFEEKPSYFRGHGITIVGSCNGLICASHAGDILYVWNPCTGEYKEINSPFGFRDRSFEFGYDSKTCDYKFVSIYCRPPNMDFLQIEIYTLGSNSWENCRSYNPFKIRKNHGVFLSGNVHWLGNLRTSNELQPRLLISMDLENGVFKVVRQPEQMDVGFDHIFVDVLRGFLCLLCSVSNTKFEIWEMKDYGVKESWSKVFKIDQQQLSKLSIRFCKCIRRAVSLKDGEILLAIIVEDVGFYNLYRVDFVKIHMDEMKRCQYRRVYECMKDVQEMEAYVESLVSVNSGTFVGKEQKDFYRAEEVLLEHIIHEIPLWALAE